MLPRLLKMWTRGQNMLLGVLLTQELDAMNVFSYPRGDQLRRALGEGPTGSPTPPAKEGP